MMMILLYLTFSFNFGSDHVIGINLDPNIHALIVIMPKLVFLPELDNICFVL